MATAAQGLTGLGLYRRREAKARVATGSGGLGGPFIGARRRRRRPTATGDAKESRGFGGERSIRIELESTNFQTILADDSKREKVEEISGNISPQLISPEKERRGRIWKKTAARVSAGGGWRLTTTPTGGPHLSATGTRARGQALGLGRPGPREREGFGPTFGPKPKETFKILFQFKLFMKCNYIY